MNHGEFLAQSAELRKRIRHHAGIRHEANELLIKTLEHDPGPERLRMWAAWLNAEADADSEMLKVQPLIEANDELKETLLLELAEQQQNPL